MMAIATTISLTSCKTDGCTDPTASNYDEDADNDDGSCVIYGCTDPDAINFNILANTSDTSCEYAYERDLFIGTYNNIIETCSDLLPYDPYSITISAYNPGVLGVTISNFGNSSFSVNGTVVGTTLTILPQSFTDNFGTFTLSGSGTINTAGTTLTMTYNYVQDGETIICQFIATK